MSRASLCGAGPSPVVKFALPLNMRLDLRRAAGSTGRSRADIVRQALREAVWFGPVVVTRREGDGGRSSVRVDWDTLAAVEALADQQHCSVGEAVVNALARHLAALDRDAVLAGQAVPGMKLLP